MFKSTKASFNFSNCTDMQRMFHILSIKAMAKAFTKAEEIVRKKLTKCQSDYAWIENRDAFTGCTDELKKAAQWINEIYADVEKLSAKESRPSFIFL